MAYKLELDQEAQVVEIRLYGTVDVDDILGAVRMMEASGVRHYSELWDFDRVRSLVLGPEDIGALVTSAVERTRQYGVRAGRLAVVAGDRTYYSISRLIQHRSTQGGADFAVFTDEAEARAWLLAHH